MTFERQPINVDGMNPWDYPWVSQERTVSLPHPSYPHQRHQLDVYKIDFGGKRITFAAGELSNGVWGFYVPAASPSGS